MWRPQFVNKSVALTASQAQKFRVIYIYNWEKNIQKSRLKKFNEMQQYADIYLLLNYSTRLGRSSRPSSGVHKNVVAASGTDHTVKYKSWTRSQILTF